MKKFGHAGGQVDSGGGGYGSALVVGGDGDVVGFGEDGDAAGARDAPVGDIGPDDIDEAIAEERLKDAGVGDPPAEAERA